MALIFFLPFFYEDGRQPRLASEGDLPPSKPFAPKLSVLYLHRLLIYLDRYLLKNVQLLSSGEKITPLVGRIAISWCRGRDLNPHGPNDRMALNHVRLPIPPPRQLDSLSISLSIISHLLLFVKKAICVFLRVFEPSHKTFSIKNERSCAHAKPSGAGDGFRTRDPLLGKQVLYR